MDYGAERDRLGDRQRQTVRQTGEDFKAKMDSCGTEEMNCESERDGL